MKKFREIRKNFREKATKNSLIELEDEMNSLDLAIREFEEFLSSRKKDRLGL